MRAKCVFVFSLFAGMVCLDLNAIISLPRLGPGQFGNDCFRLAAVIALAKENDCPLCLPDFYCWIPNSPPEVFEYYESVYRRIGEEIPLGLSYPPDFRKYFPELPTIWAFTSADKKRIAEVIPNWAIYPPYTTSYHDFGPVYHPIPYEPGIEVQGYFQCEKYFKDWADLIRRVFGPSEAIEAYLEEHFSDILSHPKTVGIHVRTAYYDWLNSKQDPRFFTQWWMAPDLDFYRSAIEMFDEDSLFIVCSDHPEWCEKNFQVFDRKFVFVKNQKFIHDFFLLTKCRDNIIMASSFGWWAAYLNENPNKRVIYRNPFLNADAGQAINAHYCVPEWTAIDMPDGFFPPIPVFN